MAFRLMALRLTQFEQLALVAILGGLVGSIVGALLQAWLSSKVTRHLRRADRRDDALLEVIRILRPIGPIIDTLIDQKPPLQHRDLYGTPGVEAWGLFRDRLEKFVLLWQEVLAVRIDLSRMDAAYEQFAGAWDLVRVEALLRREATDLWRDLESLKATVEALLECARDRLKED